MSDTAKTVEYGLALDHPGAPETPHYVPGVDGEFGPGEIRPLEEIELTGEFYDVEVDEGEEPRSGFRAEGLPARPLQLDEAKKLNELAGVALVLMKRESTKNGMGRWSRVPRKTDDAPKEG